MRVRVRVRACMRGCVMCFVIYDNDILPMLIMIIINIIILYFIQIRHTYDFPSTGTGLVYIMLQSLSLYILLLVSCLRTTYKKIQLFKVCNFRRKF